MVPPLTPETKKLVYKTIQFYKARKLDRTTAEYRDDININKTVAKVTGLSAQSVHKIYSEAKAMGDNVNFTAPKMKKQVRKKRIQMDEFTKAAVKRKVTEVYKLGNEVPSINKVRKILADEGILQCSYEYLRVLLKELGVQNKDCDNNKKKLLVENQDVVKRRSKYIRNIRKYRAEGRPIFFKDEIFINDSDKKFTATSSLQSDKDTGSSAGKCSKLVIVHAGGNSAFIDGTHTVFKRTLIGEEYQGIPDLSDFVWVREELLPSLPDNSVMVMDHPKKINKKENKVPTNKEEDNAPTDCSSKDEMQEWLTRHHIEYTEAMSRKDLLELIRKNKPKDEYKMEVILKEHGRTVLYLPPHHPEFNPIQLAWADIKKEMVQKHAKSNLGEKERALKELFAGFSTEKWQKCDSHVQTVEEEYVEDDHLSDENQSQLRNGDESDIESDSDMDCD